MTQSKQSSVAICILNIYFYTINPFTIKKRKPAVKSRQEEEFVLVLNFNSSMIVHIFLPEKVKNSDIMINAHD